MMLALFLPQNLILSSIFLLTYLSIYVIKLAI